MNRTSPIGPYRLLFPLGLLYSVSGALVWVLAAPGWISYPGPLHRVLMIEGFELGFVCGFLLTAMPGFLHAPRCQPLEAGLAASGVAGFGVAALAGHPLIAQLCALGALLVLVSTLVRRLPLRTANPPEEFVFVAFAMVSGVAGVMLLAAQAAGRVWEASPNFGVRLLSLGMVLPLVLGIGTLLVPTFAGIPRGLDLPFIARPHDSAGRRPFYAVIVLMLAAAAVADAFWKFGVAAWLRALAGTPLLVIGWKVFSRTSHPTLHAWTLRLAGWFLLAGLWLAALMPTQLVAAFHLVFVGGFGLITLGIATRVVVSHGRFALETEARVLTPLVVSAIVLAALLRVLAEYVVEPRNALLGASGAAWTLAWLAWGWRAVPLIVRPSDEQLVMPRG